jgi:hypothetical protein
MKPRTTLPRLIAAMLLAAVPASASAQVNDFEDGTTQGWQTNLLGLGGAPQPTVQSGGFGGPDDDYLLVTSLGGSGPGSRLNIINPTGWAGDYLTNGVTGFSARLINFGQTDLYLRILFEDPGAMTPPANIAYSDDAIFLPAGGGWTDAFFSASPAALLAGLGTVEGALAGTTTLRLYHSFSDAFPSPFGGGIAPVSAQLGLDDFRAVRGGGPVPEPSTWALLIVGFALAAGALRKARERGGPTRTRA